MKCFVEWYAGLGAGFSVRVFLFVGPLVPITTIIPLSITLFTSQPLDYTEMLKLFFSLFSTFTLHISLGLNSHRQLTETSLLYQLFNLYVLISVERQLESRSAGGRLSPWKRAVLSWGSGNVRRQTSKAKQAFAPAEASSRGSGLSVASLLGNKRSV